MAGLVVVFFVDFALSGLLLGATVAFCAGHEGAKADVLMFGASGATVGVVVWGMWWLIVTAFRSRFCPPTVNFGAILLASFVAIIVVLGAIFWPYESNWAANAGVGMLSAFAGALVCVGIAALLLARCLPRRRSIRDA